MDIKCFASFLPVCLSIYMICVLIHQGNKIFCHALANIFDFRWSIKGLFLYIYNFCWSMFCFVFACACNLILIGWAHWTSKCFQIFIFGWGHCTWKSVHMILLRRGHCTHIYWNVGTLHLLWWWGAQGKCIYNMLFRIKNWTLNIGTRKTSPICYI